MAERNTAPELPAMAARVLLAAILIIAVLARFRGLSWDAGLMLHPDERNLASAAARLAYPDGLVPDFHAYNGLALYLPRLLAEALHHLGFLRSTGLADIAWSARLLSACFSLATVLVIYKLAKECLDHRSALLAAFLAALAPGLVQAAHFGTTESALVLILSWIALITARYLNLTISTRRAALICGVAVGIGLGFKTTAAVFGLLHFVAFLLRRGEGRFVSRLSWLAVSGVISLAILCVTTPQILLAPKAYFGAMVFEGGVVRGTVDVFWTYQFHDARNVLFEMVQVPWLVDPVSALLILPGLMVLIWQSLADRGRARLLLPLLVFSFVYAAIVFSWHAKFIRYLLPLIPVFILSATAVYHAIARRFGKEVGLTLATGMAFSMFVAGTLQAAIYLRADSRIEAWNYLVSNMQKGEKLVVEPVEVGPPFPGGEHLTITVTPLPLIEPSSAQKLQTIADTLAAGQWMIISSRRHHRVLPSMRERFPEICGYYNALWAGRLGYDVQQSFNRRGRGMLSALDPSDMAEETYSVFDSPKAFVLRNTRKLAGSDILKELSVATAECYSAN
jgi:hypothetical protein